MKTKTKTSGKYWYEFMEYYCPLCGKSRVYKSRIDIKERLRPKEYSKRHILKEVFDYCDI